MDAAARFLTAALVLAGVRAAPSMAAPDAQGSADRDPEATRLLADLLRMDTSNPPGREAEAARLVAGWCRKEGLETTLVEDTPGRASVVARLPGTGRQPPLLLLSHLDVVPARPERWQHPPFGGVVSNGRLWGRGALDMKGMTVMEFLAVARLRREGRKPDRDLILAAVADEEAGGTHGVESLLARHPGLLTASECLNEGGFGLVARDGKPLVGLSVAERGTFWVRVTARGRAGHGSVDRPDSATRRLLRALDRLERTPRPLALVPEADALLGALAPTLPWPSSWVLQILRWPGMTRLLGPLVIAREPALAAALGPTVNPTVLVAGEKVNVIPGAAAAEIDMRTMPGQEGAGALAWLKGALGDETLELTVLQDRPGTRSPASGPLWEALVTTLRRHVPDARTTAMLTPAGTTDSASLRKHGISCIGLIPVVADQDQLETIHGDNEWIGLDQLATGTRIVAEAVARASGVSP
ncbi:MAG: M20/M25/M40 family metallo-hydrolase [Candidatus Sericytochromatia bacterium]|nr:M20/M25/M40 family metallo-hydrolase [Candidatus Sericytochromatia bacterium]